MKTKQIFIFNEDEGWWHVGSVEDMKNALDYITQEILYHSDEAGDFQIRVRIKEMTSEEVEAISEV